MQESSIVGKRKYRTQSRRPFSQNGVSDKFRDELGLFWEELFKLGRLVLSVEELDHSGVEGGPEVGGDGRGGCGRCEKQRDDDAVDFHFRRLFEVLRKTSARDKMLVSDFVQFDKSGETELRCL